MGRDHRAGVSAHLRTGPLTARFCALRVRPTPGRGDRWLLCEGSTTDERKYYLGERTVV